MGCTQHDLPLTIGEEKSAAVSKGPTESEGDPQTGFWW